MIILAELIQNLLIMKSLFLIFIVVIVSTLLLSCASPRAGVAFGTERYGYSNTTFKPGESKNQSALSDLSGSNSKTGFYIGVALKEVDINEKFSVQPEVNFIAIQDLNQFQVPILLRYTFVDDFNAFLGPNLGYLLDTSVGVNSFNFGIDLGISYDITANFIAEARYNYGISNLLENGDSNNYIKLSNFQIGIAYVFSN
jgi:opacity protein-like surface antigen